jgi:hypothetical protein
MASYPFQRSAVAECLGISPEDVLELISHGCETPTYTDGLPDIAITYSELVNLKNRVCRHAVRIEAPVPGRDVKFGVVYLLLTDQRLSFAEWINALASGLLTPRVMACSENDEPEFAWVSLKNLFF